jgi:RimJ/RimL family protein N-acetyltransferase
VRIADAALIAKWKRDPYLQQLALLPGTKITLANQKQDIEQAMKSPRQLYFIISVRETGEAIGYVRINWFDGKTAWLRFALGQQRGKGYAKDAIAVFVGYLFRIGAHRVEAEVGDFNMPSLCLLLRLGFKLEGLKRESCFDGKKFRDTYCLGLLKQDIARSRGERS